MATQTIQKPKDEIVAKLREVHDRLKAEGKIGVVAEVAPLPAAVESSMASTDSMSLEDIRADIVLIKEKVGFQRYMQALTSIDARDQEYIAALNDLSSMKPTDDMSEIRAKYARFRTAADAIFAPAVDEKKEEPAPMVNEAEAPVAEVVADTAVPPVLEMPVVAGEPTPIVAEAPAEVVEPMPEAPVAPQAASISTSMAQPLVLDVDGNIAGDKKADEATKVVLFNTPVVEEKAEMAAPAASGEKTALQKAAEALMAETTAPAPAEAAPETPAVPEVPVAAPIVEAPPVVEPPAAIPVMPTPTAPTAGGMDQYREPIDDEPKMGILPTPPAPRVVNDTYREAIDAIAEEEVPLPTLPEIPPPPPPAPPEAPISEQMGFGGTPPPAPDLPPLPPMPETGAAPQTMVQEAQTIMAQSDLSMRPEVTQGLEQLLSEWDIFASSGFLGFGSGGVEHPIYKKIRGIPVAAVMSGRWDGSNEKVIQNIKMYMDGWRKERGVEALPEEKFENYLRRVVSRILQG